jgi:hypothetical protein
MLANGLYLIPKRNHYRTCDPCLTIICTTHTTRAHTHTLTKPITKGCTRPVINRLVGKVMDGQKYERDMYKKLVPPEDGGGHRGGPIDSFFLEQGATMRSRARTAGRASSKPKNEHEGKVIPGLKKGMYASLVNPMTQSLLTSLTKELHAPLQEALHGSLLLSLRDFLNLTLTHSLEHTLGNTVALGLSQSVPLLLERVLPATLHRMLSVSLTHVVTRGLTHTLVPSLVATLSQTPAQRRACYLCSQSRQMCQLCHAHTTTVMHEALHYGNYYASYFSDFYADYYAAQLFPEKSPMKKR